MTPADDQQDKIRSGVRLARCRNRVEPDGTPCTGVLSFRPAYLEAPCDSCGGRCGRFAADYLSATTERSRSPHCVTEGPHGPHWCPEAMVDLGAFSWMEDLCVGSGTDADTTPTPAR